MRPRPGDARPLRHDARLAWWPSKPIRWRPRDGDPFCIFEWVTQQTMRTIAKPLIYAAIFTVLFMVVLLFGVPWL